MPDSKETKFDISKIRAGDRNEYQLLFKSTYQRLELFCQLYISGVAEREAIVAQVFYELFLQRSEVKNYDEIILFILENAARICIDKTRLTIPATARPDVNDISKSIQELFTIRNKNQLLQLFNKYPPVNIVRLTKSA